MRIAILSYEYPPDTGFGGIGTYSYYQARGLAKLGHDVHVFAGAAESTGITESEHDGVRVTRIKREGWLHRSLESLRQRRCWWGANRIETAYGAYTALRRELDKKGFDIVESPECGADLALVSTMLQVPSVVKFHSPARLIMNIYDTPRMDREVTAMVEQIGIMQADIRTSCSGFLAEEVATKMGVPRPIHVIPNGIDVDLFDSDEGIDPHAEFGLPTDPNAVTVFFANRMEERKGIHLVRDMCFHVMKKYPHVHFVFAGQDLFGFMEREIQPFIKKNRLDKRFHYLGKLSLPQVRAILKVANVFLIPSLWENCPYSCIEAMTAGRAIVSSDCGGMPELIRHEDNGLLAKNDDAPSFIAALERMIEDADLRDRLGTAARRDAVERLSDTAISQRAVDVYQDWLAKRA